MSNAMKLCVSLDLPTAEENLALVKEIKGFDIWLKIGFRTYIRDGKAFLEELRNWKSKQIQMLGDFVNEANDLQVLQATPEYLTEPNISNFRHGKLKQRLPADLPFIRNHDFRHSHAAYLISDGLRKGEGKDYLFFMLMKRLGHSSITTTINTYSHLFPSEQKEVANAFDNF